MPRWRVPAIACIMARDGHARAAAAPRDPEGSGLRRVRPAAVAGRDDRRRARCRGRHAASVPGRVRPRVQRGADRDPAVQLPVHRERQALAGPRGRPARRLAGGVRGRVRAIEGRAGVGERQVAGRPDRLDGRGRRADRPGGPGLPRLSPAPAGQAGAHPRRAPLADRRTDAVPPGNVGPVRVAGAAPEGGRAARRPSHARLLRGRRPLLRGPWHEARSSGDRRLPRRARRGVHPGSRD